MMCYVGAFFKVVVGTSLGLGLFGLWWYWLNCCTYWGKLYEWSLGVQILLGFSPVLILLIILMTYALAQDCKREKARK
jgi:hypothetical protein